MTHDRLMAQFGLTDEDAAAWTAAGLPEDAFEDWLVDRIARRPTGPRARAVYGGDDVHQAQRRRVLDLLRLTPQDHLLDVGCGGGILLRDALAAAPGAPVTGVDHSPDMVALARERAPGARVEEADAAALPFPDATFTAVTSLMVLFFIEDATAALREWHRVLRPGGRLVAYTSSPALKGTPAMPGPVAERAHLREDAELTTLARAAGFVRAEVQPDAGGQLLLARRG